MSAIACFRQLGEGRLIIYLNNIDFLSLLAQHSGPEVPCPDAADAVATPSPINPRKGVGDDRNQTVFWIDSNLLGGNDAPSVPAADILFAPLP